MVGAGAVVAPARSTELGERHDRDPARPRRRQHLVEACDRSVELAHAGPVLARLSGVAVEVAPTGAEYPQTEVGVDQSGHHLQLGDERHVRELIVRWDQRGERGGKVELVDLRAAHSPTPSRGIACAHAAQRRVDLLVAGVRRCTERRPSSGDRGAALYPSDEMQRHRLTDLRGGVEVLGATEVPIEPAAEPS